MKQYCRYCAYAIDYLDVLVCTAKSKCGNNGTGKTYSMNKAKQLNKCKYFEFNSNDLIGVNKDGSFRQYKPRKNQVVKIDLNQLKIF